MSSKLGLLLAALIVSTHAKLLGKLLMSGSSGCGQSSLQIPRLNLLSMLCRPSAMTSWMGSSGFGGWSGMGSYNQYPSYGGSYGSSYPSSYGSGYASAGAYTAYPGYGSGYAGYGQQAYSSPWTYSSTGLYGQQRKGREFVPKSPGQAISSLNNGKYNPASPPSKSSTNEVVQQQVMQSY